MDPISIIGSIVGVVDLTGKVVSFVKGPDTQRLAGQLISLSKLLEQLQASISKAEEQSEPRTPWLEDVGLVKDDLVQLQNRLEEVARRLSHNGTPIERLKSALNRRVHERGLRDAFEDIERILPRINAALGLTSIKYHVEMQKAVASIDHSVTLLTSSWDDDLENRTREEIGQWLKAPDPRVNFANAKRLHLPGTGQWLLNSREFADWKEHPGSFLWLYGIPGCGKTVLSSSALDHIHGHCQRKEPNTAVVYFYFDFNDSRKRQCLLFIRSVLYQLCLCDPQCFEGLRSLRRTSTKSSMPLSDDTVLNLIDTSIDRLPKTYLIVDALDECHDREPLLQFLVHLSTRHGSKLHLLAASRECDITKRLSKHVTQPVNIQSAVVDEDILFYINHHLETDERLQKWRDIAFDDIRSGLMAKANGMFRWVDCQLQLIKGCKKHSRLLETLQSLPKSLDETYNRLIRDIIADDEQSDAIRVLQWLCYAQRPLSLPEIVDVLATSPGRNGEFRQRERLADPYDLIAICTSLITVVEVEKHGQQATQVRLAHYSVQEYLLSPRCSLGNFAAQQSNFDIAETCLAYLLYTCRLARILPNSSTIEAQPLCSYAASNWYVHTKLSGSELSTVVAGFAIDQLFDQVDLFEAWATMPSDGLQVSNDLARDAYERRKMSPLYYASNIGIPEIVKHLLEKGADPNLLQDSRGQSIAEQDLRETALGTAVLGGHLEVVRVLLSAGANPNARGNGGNTPLENASFKGDQDIVKALLEGSADANIPTKTAAVQDLALQAAAEMGHVGVVEILLRHGADPHAIGSDYGNALNAAAFRGSIEIVRMLIDAGVDPGYQTDMGNALLYAADAGHEHIIRLLLDKGVNVNQLTEYSCEHATALQAAAYEGHESIVRLLVERGADVNAPPGANGSALHAAIVGRGVARVAGPHESIADHLKALGADDVKSTAEPIRRNRTRP